MDYCAALCMMIMASIFLSGLGWVVLQASFVGWVGLGWVGSQKMDPRTCRQNATTWRDRSEPKMSENA